MSSTGLQKKDCSFINITAYQLQHSGRGIRIVSNKAICSASVHYVNVSRGASDTYAALYI